MKAAPFLYSLAVFAWISLLLYFKYIPKASHKLALMFVFTQIIVLLIFYRCNEDDITRSNTEKQLTNLYTKAYLY